MDGAPRGVVTDTNILINFCHIGRLDLLEDLPRYQFVVCAFVREATARLGKGRLLTTPGILVLTIHAGRLTVEDADRAKRVLEERRFKMAFGSFADVVGPKGQKGSP